MMLKRVIPIGRVGVWQINLGIVGAGFTPYLKAGAFLVF